MNPLDEFERSDMCDHADAYEAHCEWIERFGWPGSAKRAIAEGRARFLHPTNLGNRDDVWADFYETDPARSDW